MKLANELRNMGEFAEAQNRYLNVLEDKPEEHEARWGLLLCKYGVMYVDAPKGKERLITCRRSLTSSIRDEAHYQIVLEQAPSEVRAQYEKDAEYIDRIQGEIRLLWPRVQPFDVFLCYKETAPEGGKTEDSKIAHGIYNDLTHTGYRVFFAPVSLKGQAGANYEAAIFLAIESSRVMLVLGTKKEYFDSAWVRSEWRRFLERIDLGDETKLLIPLFRSDADLPDTFKKRFIQGYDMNRPYMNDIKTCINEAMPKEDSCFKLVRISLSIGDFQEAEHDVKELLKEQPENPQLWLYRAMISEQIQNEADLCRVGFNIQENKYFQIAMRYASVSMRERLQGYLVATENVSITEETDYTKETCNTQGTRKVGEEHGLIEKFEKKYPQSIDYDECETVDDYKWKKLPDGTAGIKEYIGKETEVHIPSTISGFPITRILKECFKDAPNLTKIFISKSVTSIEDNAFENCEDLGLFPKKCGWHKNRRRNKWICRVDMEPLIYVMYAS